MLRGWVRMIILPTAAGSPFELIHMIVPLILNPASGDATPNVEKAEQVASRLATHGIEANIIHTEIEKSAGDIATELVEAGHKRIFVAGGDGTVSLVASAVAQTPATLGIIPLGTFNNISRSVGIPEDMEAACDTAANGREFIMDAGCCGDDRLFFEAVGCGLDAAVFPAGEEIKNGNWLQVWRVLRVTMAYQMAAISLKFDRPVSEATVLRGHRYRKRTHHTLRLRALLVVVANGPYYGAGMTVAPGARLDDGLLTINVYRHFSKLALIRHFMGIGRGNYQYSPKVESFTAAEVTLTSKPSLPIHADGSPIGNSPETIKIVPNALRVIVPDKLTKPNQS